MFRFIEKLILYGLDVCAKIECAARFMKCVLAKSIVLARHEHVCSIECSFQEL